jgi:phosphoribosylglycinamide formyltransferase-1
MSNTQKKRIVALISGSGSNLQAIIDACTTNQVAADVVAVISNRPNVKGLSRAKLADIPAITLDHKNFESREAFDAELATTIESYQADIVVLAGFMRILTDNFVDRFQGRLLNIHPSLLPKYPGLHTHQRAIDEGDSHSGATVHFVISQLDGGPPIIQASVAIQSGDTAESLASRVLTLEHKIYPKAIDWLCQNRLAFVNGKALLDGKEIPSQGVQYTET